MLREDRAQGEERARGHPAQEGGHESEWRLLIEPPDADPGAPTVMGWCRGPSQSDRDQGECDNDCDYAEGSEPCRVRCREKELSDDPGQQSRHGIDAHNLSSGFFRRGAVEPALDDNEQSGKAEPGQGASHYPRHRIQYKQVQERRG